MVQIFHGLAGDFDDRCYVLFDDYLKLVDELNRLKAKPVAALLQPLKGTGKSE